MSKTLRGAITGTAVALTVLFGASTAQAVNIPGVTDEYLFSSTLKQFTSVRAQQPYAGRLDWSSDGCSWSPDSPFGFQFLSSCHRHDFGYRNYKRQSRFTESNRLRIDDNFKADLYKTCAGNWACKRTADVYYAAVRKFGGTSSSTAAAIESYTN